MNWKMDKGEVLMLGPGTSINLIPEDTDNSTPGKIIYKLKAIFAMSSVTISITSKITSNRRRL